MADTTKKANIIARSLFIVGGIILFIVLVIFIIRLVPVVISGIANIGSAVNPFKDTKEEIIVKTDKEVLANKQSTVFSFEYTPVSAGQYFVSYSCSNGLFFDIQSVNGPQRLICDTPFRLGSNLNAISLVPIFTTANTFVDSTVKIEYKDERNNTIATGTKLVTITTSADTIQNGTDSTQSNTNQFDASLAASTVTATQAPQSATPVQSTPTATVQTNPTRDFAVTQIFPIANQSAFTFYTYNYGNTSTGPWFFTYTDAENPSRTITSPAQASLAPGQGLAVTVRFDYQANTSQVVAITVNPTNTIRETNYSNNTAVVTLNGSTSNNNNNDWNSSGRADLEITSMQVGRISGSRFISTSTINEDDRGAIKFTVFNRGGENTGTWRFEVYDLPYASGDQTYVSPSQASLRPGEYREILVEFEGLRTGRYNPEVYVDSRNDVREDSENNNRQSKRLTVES